jgi:hypothetical protein
MIARVPAAPTTTICSAIVVFSITGFYVTFAALLYRAYKIGQIAGIQMKSKAIVTPEAGDGQDKKTRIAFAVVGIACAILAIAGSVMMEEPTLHTVVLENGVREFEFLICTKTLAKNIFLGIEGMIVVSAYFLSSPYLDSRNLYGI